MDVRRDADGELGLEHFRTGLHGAIAGGVELLHADLVLGEELHDAGHDAGAIGRHHFHKVTQLRAVATLAGAVAASKLHIPIVHIEAGLRSFNKSMPEEINRIMCDHVSTLLFAPTEAGFRNLLREGFRENNDPPYSIDNPKVYHSGDVMYDNTLFFSAMADEKTDIIAKYKLEPGAFILATIHRNNNTDDPERLNALFGAMYRIANEHEMRIVIPLHPRTAKLLANNLTPGLYSQVKTCRFISIIPPVSFLEMIALEKNASLVMTDSGGVQKEAFFFKKPCIILRSETEWVELVDAGWNSLVGADAGKIERAVTQARKGKENTAPYGDGNAANRIVELLMRA